MNVPEGLQYTESHEWIKIDGLHCVCGISDYAQKQLSDIVFVELPETGKQVKKGDVLCVVESVKAASDIYAPVAGTITKVNDALTSSPDMLNSDPYGDGWICEMDITSEAEVSGLQSSDQYKEKIK